MRTSDDQTASRPDWTETAARIRSGDPAAAEEFRAAFRQGIRFLLTRQLGARAADDAVDETLRMAIEGIRQGWLNDGRDLVALLRRQVGELRGLPWAPGSRGGAPDGAKVRTIGRRLAEASPRARELLIRYYVYGQSVDRIRVEMGACESELRAARAALTAPPEESPAGAAGFPVTDPVEQIG